MRREERVTVQGPVKEQPPDGMSHRGLEKGLQQHLCFNTIGTISRGGWHEMTRLMCGQPKAQKLHTNKWCNPNQ